MTTARPQRDRMRDEGGAMLLVALVLCATLSLLSIALLSSHDGAVRGRANAALSRDAEAAAAAGVEWAAARDTIVGRVAGTTTLDLGNGRRAVVTVATSSPHVVSEGRHGGARVTLSADLNPRGTAPLPHAFASFDGTNYLDHKLTVVGPVYLGDTSTPLSGGRVLEVGGDLHVVTTNTLPAGMVQHTSGTTFQGLRRLPTPTVDTSPFAAMPASATVRHHSGTTLLKNLNFTGIVVVRLGSGQTLTIEDSTINGAVVVTASAGLLGGGGLLGLGVIRPVVRLKGVVTLTGGNATAGNLALLAAFCTLDGNTSGSAVNGVTVVYDCENIKLLTFTGQLVLLDRLRDADTPWRVDRVPTFVVDTPLGIQWTGQASTEITWLGRQ